jgi:hypothetical protein
LTVLIGAHDEWQVAERRYLSEASMAQLTPPTPTVLILDVNSTQEVSPAPALLFGGYATLALV